MLGMQGGPIGVLLFHGLKSSQIELQFVARSLHRAGHGVEVPHIRHFSWEPDHSRRQGNWRDWREQAMAAFDDMAQRHERVFVGGLCIGSALALQVAAARPEKTAGVLALSTTLHYDGWGVPWKVRFLGLAPWVPGATHWMVPEGEPYGVKDTRLRKWIVEQMASTGTSVAGAAGFRLGEILQARRLIRATRRQLPRITAPVLVLHARDDEIASLRSANEVLGRVRSATTRCVILADSYHMISIDQEKALVAAEMKRFIDDVIQPPSRHTHARATQPARSAAPSSFNLLHWRPSP